MENLKVIIKKEIDDIKRVGIVYAKDWFHVFVTFHGADSMPGLINMIRPDDFVVCRWSDFHDGQNSHIEGMETIAICRSIEDAYLLYNLKTK
jgi:hypothetical protein